MAKNITPKEKDYSQWYLDIIKVGELADYAPVRGCMVVRPTGYAVWEMIQSTLTKHLKRQDMSMLLSLFLFLSHSSQKKPNMWKALPPSVLS